MPELNITLPTGAVLAVVDAAPGLLGDTNAALQIAASIASAKSAANPGNTHLAADAAGLGWAAMGTAYKALKVDQAENNQAAALGDLISIVGDMAIVAGAIATEIPEAQEFAEACDTAGTILTYAGLAVSPTINSIKPEIAFLMGQANSEPVNSTSAGIALGQIFYNWEPVGKILFLMRSVITPHRIFGGT